MSDTGNDHRSLRARAEAILDVDRDAPNGQGLEELQTALHNLKVHQIELELQNEELRFIQAELERTKARYFQLYNSAPIGYLTLNASGIILNSNRESTNWFIEHFCCNRAYQTRIQSSAA